MKYYKLTCVLLLVGFGLISTSTTIAQVFEKSFTEKEKQMVSKKIISVINENSSGISHFWIGKAADGNLFFNYCTSLPYRFKNGYEKIDYPENRLYELEKNKTEMSSYKRSNRGGQCQWSRQVIAFDAEGRILGNGSIIEVRNSLSKKKSKILYTYVKSKSKYSYPNDSTMVVSYERFKYQRKKKAKPVLEASTVLTINKNGNTIISEQAKTFYNKNGKATTETSKVEVQIDEAGRTIASKTTKGDCIISKYECVYNDKGWLSTYKETLYDQSTGVLKAFSDGKIEYKLKENEDSERESSYNDLVISDEYNEKNELYKQFNGTTYRMKNSDGSWGVWKQLTY